MSDTDSLYAASQPYIVDFAFDDAVADVFPDMIRRSVPGYETIVSLLAVIAETYFQPGTKIYDLGCSLGAGILAVHSRLGDQPVKYVAVDGSSSMMDKCKQNLSRHIPSSHYQCLHQDIRDTEIGGASVVIMNFTLQFLPQQDRDAVVKNIYEGLSPGGALILCEKVFRLDQEENDLLVDLHHQFKSANGYSDLEISQKRTALENVMNLNSVDEHLGRLKQMGFSQTAQWFQCFNFIGLLAVK
ncbi:MAG: carboxy-S-adenosyl-L-methionine synthase CmoA [bacterium]